MNRQQQAHQKNCRGNVKSYRSLMVSIYATDVAILACISLAHTRNETAVSVDEILRDALHDPCWLHTELYKFCDETMLRNNTFLHRHASRYMLAYCETSAWLASSTATYCTDNDLPNQVT